MPHFTITAPGGRKIEIDAPDEQAALAGAKQYVARYPDPTTAPRPGSGPRPAEMAARTPRPGAPSKPSLVRDITGGLANLNRGIGIGDEIMGGINTAVDVARGGSHIDPVGALAAFSALQRGDYAGGAEIARRAGIQGAFEKGMARQRGIEDDFSARRPLAAQAIRSTGAAGTMFVPGGQENAAVQGGGRLMAGARGATTAAAQAAAYGLADRGTLQQRAETGRNSAAIAAPLGFALGAGLAPATPKPAKRPGPPSRGSQRQTDLRTLRNSGTHLTPGQGGIIPKPAEDIMARFPILGQAIRGARARGGESFNRAVANRALAPLGEVVPPEINTGPDAVAYVSRRLGKAFDDAYGSIPRVQAEQPFVDGLRANAASRMRELTPDNQRVLSGIIDQRLARLRDPNLSGAEAGRIRSELGGLSAKYLKSGDPNQQALGSILRDVGNEVDGLIERSDPTGQVGAALNRARQGWGSFAVLRRAASGANTGTFTPQGLMGAVRANDSSVGRGAVARGEANMQDLAGAAARVMPDSFGNPGTADSLGYMMLGGGIATHPPSGIAAAAGLTAAATPYMLMARGVVSKLPPNASATELQGAANQLAVMAQKDPQVAPLLGEIQRRLAQSAGLASEQTQQPAR